MDTIVKVLPIIPITEFQKNTKKAFQRAVQKKYRYVTSRNKEVAVVVDPKFFVELAKCYEEKHLKRPSRVIIDEPEVIEVTPEIQEKGERIAKAAEKRDDESAS